MIYQKRIKKILDKMIALAACIILAPLYIMIGISIKLDSPGSIMFCQKRVGIYKTYFSIYKFRTMRTNAPKECPTHVLSDPQKYITRVGKFLRKTSLDELPQLFNVLQGNMSLVGPRPALWNQFDLINEREKYGANDIMPGITGWAQINGRDEIAIEKKAELDGYYAKNIGFWLDIKCLFLTVSKVIKREGIKEGK